MPSKRNIFVAESVYRNEHDGKGSGGFVTSKLRDEENGLVDGERRRWIVLKPFFRWLLVGIATVIVMSVTYQALVTWG